MGKQIIILAFVVAAVAGGSWMVTHGYRTHAEAKQSLSWTETPAVVKAYTINSPRSVKRTPSSTRSGQPSRPASEATVEMLFSYEANGQTYESDRACFGPQVPKLLPPRPEVGETITIRYDPADPAEAVWVAGPTGRSRGLMIAGVATIALPLVIAAWLFARKRSN